MRDVTEQFRILERNKNNSWIRFFVRIRRPHINIDCIKIKLCLGTPYMRYPSVLPYTLCGVKLDFGQRELILSGSIGSEYFLIENLILILIMITCDFPTRAKQEFSNGILKIYIPSQIPTWHWFVTNLIFLWTLLGAIWSYF